MLFWIYIHPSLKKFLGRSIAFVDNLHYNLQTGLILSSLLAGLASGSENAKVEEKLFVVTSFHNSYLEFLFPTYYAGSWLQKRNGELRVQRGSFLIRSVVTYVGDISHGMLLWVLVVNDYSFQNETARLLSLVSNLRVPNISLGCMGTYTVVFRYETSFKILGLQEKSHLTPCYIY